MSSLVRRIQKRLLANVPRFTDAGDPISAAERAEIIAVMRKDRQGKRRGPARGSRRTTNQRGKGATPRTPRRWLSAEAMRPQPRPVRGRHPVTGRKLGGAKSAPSPAPTHRYRLRGNNSDPAYRKSIWPAAKLARQ